MNCSVYINGRLVGSTDQPELLYKNLVLLRRKGEITSHANFSYDKRFASFYVNTDRGRARRPYIIVNNAKSTLTPEVREKLKTGELTWEDLVAMGIIEYLDAEEEEMVYIAQWEQELNEKHTHLEVDPISILGIVAGALPYPNHNLSARNSMAASQAKQSLGVFTTNYVNYYFSRSYVMYYPQKPLVTTRTYEYLNMEMHPAGQNFVIAVMSYEYNTQDAIIINKGSIDRGIGRVAMFRTYEAEERRYPGGQKDKFEIPPPTVSGYRGEEVYKYLGSDGIICPEVNVKSGDVLIGRTSPPRFLEEISVFGIIEEKKRESSVAVKNGEKAVVDSVAITDSLSGNRMVKIRLRCVKVPEIGDKFAARSGQKGVIGMILPQEDIPFTKHGINPDLIINSHAIPSRMTFGHIIEMLGAKAASLSGERADGSAFINDNIDDFKTILKEYGFDEFSEEEMYDPVTGKKLKAKIFVGTVYYQRLHHLVSNKIHARSRGPVQLLTRQPTEGRSREGGLRFGEMERDCLIGYGSAMLIKERLLDESDKTTAIVCAKCGSIGYHDYTKNKDMCSVCDGNRFYRVEVSYAFKLLMDEIISLGVHPKILLGDKTG